MSYPVNYVNHDEVRVVNTDQERDQAIAAGFYPQVVEPTTPLFDPPAQSVNPEPPLWAVPAVVQAPVDPPVNDAEQPPSPSVDFNADDLFAMWKTITGLVVNGDSTPSRAKSAAHSLALLETHLSNLGFDVVHGFLVAKPVPADPLPADVA